jgi:hypothetical protein
MKGIEAREIRATNHVILFIGPGYSFSRIAVFTRSFFPSLGFATLTPTTLARFEQSSVNKQGNPPALPGDSKSLTFTEVFDVMGYNEFGDVIEDISTGF